MSADYIDVSKQITLSGKHEGPDVPVNSYGLFYPDEDRVDRVGAAVDVPNPDDEAGFYEIHVNDNNLLLSPGQTLTRDLFAVYEGEITAAVKEAAEATRV